MNQSSFQDDNLIKNNYDNPDINRLREFQKFLSDDDTQIKEIIKNNSSFNNEDFSVSLNDLKAILFEIASFYQVNLETFLESFLVKFREQEVISYLDFMNYFIENLNKQEKILAAININNSLDNNNNNNPSYFNGELTENYNPNVSLDNNNNYNLKLDNSLNQPDLRKDDLDYQENKINSLNINNLNETDNLFLMILHRSLYILKKKFELNKNEINNIYEEHSEKNKFNKILNTDNFISVLDKIFKKCSINFLDINQPSDLFKAEIIENYSEEKLSMIEKQIKSFMLNRRKYYNDRFKFKREKEFFEIFLKEKEAIASTIKLATENNSNSNTIAASENVTPKNPTNKKTVGKKANNNKLNESVNNANNVSLNESKISKLNDPKKRESNANVTLKNAKNNAGNTSNKNLNISRKESEVGKSKKIDSKLNSKTNLKKQVSKQESSKSIVGNIKQVEDKEEPINDIDINNNVDNVNLLEENLNIETNSNNNNNENMIGSDKNNIIADLNLKENDGKGAKNNIIAHSNLKENDGKGAKNNNNDLFSAIENLEDFRTKKLDDEIKTIILDDGNNNDLNLKINKNSLQDNSLKYLIIDAIPLIIADFIHENINIAILDMSDDLKSDLRGLFDKEIIKKIEEQSHYDIENERVLKLKEYLFEKLNTQKNIKTYEDLFLTKKTQGENTSHILNILEKLRNHLSLIEKKIKKLQNNENQISNKQGFEKNPIIIDNVLNLNDNNMLENSGFINNKGQKGFVSKIIPRKSNFLIDKFQIR